MGKKKEPTSEPLTGKAAKDVRKAEKAAAEAARKAEADAMMAGLSDEEDYEQEEEEDEELERLKNPDLVGAVTSRVEKLSTGQHDPSVDVTITQGCSESSVSSSRPQSSRVSARKERMAKETDLSAIAAEAEAAMAAVAAKAEAGEKLSGKEKKLLQRYKDKMEQQEQAVEVEDAGLRAFSLSLPGGAAASRRERARAKEAGRLEGEDEEDGSGGLSVGTDIIVEGFSLSAPKRELFTDATLRLNQGRRYGLLGPNGRGKSTLLRHLARGRFPLPAGVDVLYVEQEAKASKAPVIQQVLESDVRRVRLLAEEAQLLKEWDQAEQAEQGGGKQEVMWSSNEWCVRASRLVALSEELDHIGADSAEGRVKKILTGLGFTDSMQEGGTTTLSGGWRMRVSLASALFVSPRLLLLDEPTNHLDLDAALWLGDHLENHWKHTMVVVSHDRDFLDQVSTDLIHLERKQLNYYGAGIGKFHAAVELETKKAEKEYQAQQKALKEAKAKATGKSAAAVEEAVMRKLGVKSLLERPSEYRVKFQFRSPPDPGPCISLHDVAFHYPGAPNNPIFTNLNFKVDGSSRVAIVGPNGAGKSTLLGLITGALQPTSGEVLSSRVIRLGCYSQHFEELLPLDKTGVQFLMHEYKVTENDARATLGRFGLDGARHLIRIAELSGGQKARVLMSYIALKAPHLLVLDEPTNHLDMESVDALVEGLRAYEGGLVLVSHDQRLIARTDCQLWVCQGDKKVSVDSLGFAHYRQGVLRAIAAKQEKLEQEAKRKADKARENRRNKLEAISARAAKERSKAPPAPLGGEKDKEESGQNQADGGSKGQVEISEPRSANDGGSKRGKSARKDKKGKAKNDDW